jgi:hypothetical protein
VEQHGEVAAGRDGGDMLAAGALSERVQRRGLLHRRPGGFPNAQRAWARTALRSTADRALPEPAWPTRGSKRT